MERLPLETLREYKKRLEERRAKVLGSSISPSEYQKLEKGQAEALTGMAQRSEGVEKSRIKVAPASRPSMRINLLGGNEKNWKKEHWLKPKTGTPVPESTATETTSGKTKTLERIKKLRENLLKDRKTELERENIIFLDDAKNPKAVAPSRPSMRINLIGEEAKKPEEKPAPKETVAGATRSEATPSTYEKFMRIFRTPERIFTPDILREINSLLGDYAKDKPITMEELSDEDKEELLEIVSPRKKTNMGGVVTIYPKINIRDIYFRIKEKGKNKLEPEVTIPAPEASTPAPNLDLHLRDLEAEVHHPEPQSLAEPVPEPAPIPEIFVPSELEETEEPYVSPWFDGEKIRKEGERIRRESAIAESRRATENSPLLSDDVLVGDFISFRGEVYEVLETPSEANSETYVLKGKMNPKIKREKLTRYLESGEAQLYTEEWSEEDEEEFTNLVSKLGELNKIIADSEKRLAEIDAEILEIEKKDRETTLPIESSDVVKEEILKSIKVEGGEDIIKNAEVKIIGHKDVLVVQVSLKGKEESSAKFNMGFRLNNDQKIVSILRHGRAFDITQANPENLRELIRKLAERKAEKIEEVLNRYIESMIETEKAKDREINTVEIKNGQLKITFKK